VNNQVFDNHSEDHGLVLDKSKVLGTSRVAVSKRGNEFSLADWIRSSTYILYLGVVVVPLYSFCYSS
jgi:hypothetical protein